MAAVQHARRPMRLSEEQSRLARCAGKQRFVNPTLAHRALRRSRIKGRVAYHCNHCGGWHLGSTESGK